MGDNNNNDKYHHHNHHKHKYNSVCVIRSAVRDRSIESSNLSHTFQSTSRFLHYPQIIVRIIEHRYARTSSKIPENTCIHLCIVDSWIIHVERMNIALEWWPLHSFHLQMTIKTVNNSLSEYGKRLHCVKLRHFARLVATFLCGVCVFFTILFLLFWNRRRFTLLIVHSVFS